MSDTPTSEAAPRPAGRIEVRRRSLQQPPTSSLAAAPSASIVSMAGAGKSVEQMAKQLDLPETEVRSVLASNGLLDVVEPKDGLEEAIEQLPVVATKPEEVFRMEPTPMRTDFRSPEKIAADEATAAAKLAEATTQVAAFTGTVGPAMAAAAADTAAVMAATPAAAPPRRAVRQRAPAPAAAAPTLGEQLGAITQADIDAAAASMKPLVPVSNLGPGGPVLPVEHDVETDGRHIAEVPSVPGAMAYGRTPTEAEHAARAIARERIGQGSDPGAIRGGTLPRYIEAPGLAPTQEQLAQFGKLSYRALRGGRSAEDVISEARAIVALAEALGLC